MANMDCFAYVNGGCMALNECVCKHNDKCPFYKTKMQIEVDYLCALRRKKRLNLTIDIVNANNNY